MIRTTLLIAAAFLPCGYLSGAVSDGLILHMPMDGTNADLTGVAANPVTVGPATFEPSLIGQSINFSNGPASSAGTGQYLAVGSEPEFSFGPGQDFSVSLWVNTTDYVNGDNLQDPPLIANKDWDAFGNPGWIIAGGSGTSGAGGWQWNLDTSVATNVSFRPPATSSRIDDGQWHHIAVVHDRDLSAVFYHDGERIGAVNIASHNGGTVGAGLPTAIASDGRFGLDWSVYFNGAIDDVAMWNRTLDEEEIGKIFFGGSTGLNVQELTDVDLASIEVNTQTGDIELNSGLIPANINSYAITSDAGSLDSDGWLAGNLAAQGLDSIGSGPGESWEVIEASPNQLFEAFLLGSSDFSDDRTEALGNAFDTAVGVQDLMFTYTLVTGQEISGDVIYVDGFDTADFDKDGDVDGEDFLIWQLGFGTTSGATQGDGDTDGDGDVDGEDFLAWQLQFQGDEGASAAAVPEFGSGLLFVVLASAIALRPRQCSLPALSC